ncbi:cytochrome P450 [Infundibulicybe gibba]|nr:cytochrome P450 [Infundibulicybe gibba]
MLPGSLYVAWHERYGKIVKFSGAFGHQVLSITDPRAISFILSEEPYAFPKPRGVRAWFEATLGKGILWVEGKEAHEKQRRSLAPALSQQSVRNLTPIFYETSARLASQWLAIIDQGQGDKAEIEVTNWAGRFASARYHRRAAFTYDFDCLAGEPHPLAEALDGLTNNENKASSFYMRALFWIFPSILSIGKKGEMIRRTKQELGDIASKMWREVKVTGETTDKTVMALMLKADGSMSEEQIVAQMRSTISAAYETVSAVIAWVLYELSRHPTIQDSLRAEVSTAGDPSLDILNSFPLLEAVLKETLRLHPAVIENHHEAAKDIHVPLSEPLPGTSELQFLIPKGTILSFPVNVIQQDPQIWGDDAHLFRPQRWLERKAKGIRADREIFSFSEGPRSCIGRAFAVAEIKVLVVTLIRQFSLSCRHEIEAFQSFVIRPRIKGQGPSSLPLVVRKI